MAAKNTPPRSDARLAAREVAAAQRNAQLKKDRRNRMIIIGILILAVFALAAAIFWINKQGEAKPLADTEAPKATTVDGGISFGKGRVAGTDNGPDAVEIGVYSDFSCSYCEAFDIKNSAAINTLLESGDATLVFHPVAILQPQFSRDTAEATAYLADKSPEHVLDFVNTVFATQPSENGPLSKEQTQSAAESVGVDPAIAKDMFNGDWKKWVVAASNDASNNKALQNDKGGFGTPTITIDGKRLDEKYNWTVDGQLTQAAMDAKAAK